MKRWVGVIGLGLIAVAGLGVGFVLRSTSDAVRYEVVRGDTLGKIAKTYDVSVDDLRRWNGIDGDLIEVGQVLLIHATGTVEAPSPRKRARRPTPGSPPEAPKQDTLVRPKPKPCLSGPTGEGLADEGAVASTGLSYAQIKSSMDAFVPHTLRCVPEGTSGRLETKIVVGCNGTVSAVEIGATGGLPAEVVACVKDTLTYAEFPAHALPDGEVFDYPLTFSWD
ncbi:MAG: LysM peptidoglycan-binding domain-containing protein [Deltaproteobacteria bacterium]|nr:MAG: LysM peptidoglycan-binding domain-containing protein [Deltaproteobacteria bacterium]